MLSADAPEDTTEAWKQDLGDRIEEIIDRKRSSVQGRETTLAQYVHILMSHYAYDEIDGKESELFPALMKSVKSENSEKETSLALRGSSKMGITILELPKLTLDSYCTYPYHHSIGKCL